MKNLDRRFYVKTSFRFIFYLYKTLNGNQNNWIHDMSTRRFLIETLLHTYNARHTKLISDFSFTYITHKLKEHLVRAFTIS